MTSYDAIVVGAGHNGLVTACYLAKAGLKVLVVEKNEWIGGAAVSRSLHDGFTYSNCSYVASAPRSGRCRRARRTCSCTTTWVTSTATSAPGGFARGGMGAITQALAKALAAYGCAPVPPGHPAR